MCGEKPAQQKEEEERRQSKKLTRDRARARSRLSLAHNQMDSRAL